MPHEDSPQDLGSGPPAGGVSTGLLPLVLRYAAVASLWIILSDKAAEWLPPPRALFMPPAGVLLLHQGQQPAAPPTGVAACSPEFPVYEDIEGRGEVCIRVAF
jgi:hypothetical protein